jgi:hypothetical protein
VAGKSTARASLGPEEMFDKPAQRTHQEHGCRLMPCPSKGYCALCGDSTPPPANRQSHSEAISRLQKNAGTLTRGDSSERKVFARSDQLLHRQISEVILLQPV